jgi:hypothetical protein
MKKITPPAGNTCKRAHKRHREPSMKAPYTKPYDEKTPAKPCQKEETT